MGGLSPALSKMGGTRPPRPPLWRSPWMLGGPRYAPNCTLRGEVGASVMKTKVIKGHLQYIRNTLQGNNTLLKEIMVTQMEEGYTRWAKTTKTYLKFRASSKEFSLGGQAGLDYWGRPNYTYTMCYGGGVHS